MLTGRLFALERWAERSPRVRFPLLLLALLLLWGLAGGLSACGGGEPADAPAPREGVQPCARPLDDAQPAGCGWRARGAAVKP